MSDVKWIKIVTDIFDDEKIQEIEVMPDGDRTFLTWLYLYSKAKRSRRGEPSPGGFTDVPADDIPF